jgi:hypothetical protein
MTAEASDRRYRRFAGTGKLFPSSNTTNINYIKLDSLVLRIQRSEVRILSGTPCFSLASAGRSPAN